MPRSTEPLCFIGPAQRVVGEGLLTSAVAARFEIFAGDLLKALEIAVSGPDPKTTGVDPWPLDYARAIGNQPAFAGGGALQSIRRIRYMKSMRSGYAGSSRVHVFPFEDLPVLAMRTRDVGMFLRTFIEIL